jgi:hypothetical protein
MNRRSLFGALIDGRSLVMRMDRRSLFGDLSDGAIALLCFWWIGDNESN